MRRDVAPFEQRRDWLDPLELRARFGFRENVSSQQEASTPLELQREKLLGLSRITKTGLRVGSGGLNTNAGRFGSGQVVFEISWVGSPFYPIRPARRDPIREKS